MRVPALALSLLVVLLLWGCFSSTNDSTEAPANIAATLNIEPAVAQAPTLAVAKSSPTSKSKPSTELQESYCMWPGESLSEISLYTDVAVDRIELFNPRFTGFAGSTLLLPPESIPPHAWSQPKPEVASMKELPFGVSGYYISPDNRRKRVALTFDVGYVPENQELYKLLAERKIRATFFVIGTAISKRPDVVIDIHRHGHEVANHSWTHDYMQFMTEEEIIKELVDTELAVQKAHPEATSKPFFRAPFGAINHKMVEVAKREGYYTVGWTIDSGDWVPGITPDDIFQRVRANLCPGAILVMHDANLPSFAALPRILDYLEQQGYEVVPLSRLLFS